MADPVRYSVGYSFSSFQANSPNTPLPAPKLNIELANISTSTESLRSSVSDIRRSDGQLANDLVTYDSLAPEIRLLFDNGAVDNAILLAQAVEDAQAAEIGAEAAQAAAEAAAAIAVGAVNPATLFAGSVVPEVNVAAATTTDIGAAASARVTVTGAATITSFGSQVNRLRIVRFAGASVLKHNATSLILVNGGVGYSRIVAAGDQGVYLSDASGNWRELTFVSAAGTGAMAVATRALAAATAISPSVLYLETGGYATVGDGGGARYTRGTISSPGAFQDAGDVYWGLDLAAGVVNPLWFGAKGDGVTDDTIALQASTTAAVAIGGELFLPPKMLKITSAISVTGRVSVRGCGFHTTPTNYGFGATTNSFDTRSSGFRASVIICGTTHGAFLVETTDSVLFQNFHVTHPAVPNSSVITFDLNSAAGDTGCNMNSIIRDVLINGAYTAIRVTDWLQFEFNNIYFTLCTQPIIAENLRSVNFAGLSRSASCGDSKIIGCTFFITQGDAAIELLSGSGYRIANNKFQASNAGLPNAACILISPQNLGYAFSMTPGVIADNSFEGFGNGIYFNPNASSQGELSLWTITGNEFFCTIGINMASGVAIPRWMGAISIVGNTFTYGQNGSVAPCVSIAGAGQVLVGDNIFAGAAAGVGAAVAIGANTTNLKIGNNLYDGTAQPPGVLTPALPASGVGVTNTTGYTVIVNVYGGTVGSIVVNMANSAGNPTVSQVTNCAVVLNPNDQIVLTYSGGPAWVWRALNP